VPKILETPYIGEDKNTKKPPYLQEIAMLRAKQFDESVRNKITAGVTV
jgi:deoxyribonuclease-4